MLLRPQIGSPPPLRYLATMARARSESKKYAEGRRALHIRLRSGGDQALEFVKVAVEPEPSAFVPGLSTVRQRWPISSSCEINASAGRAWTLRVAGPRGPAA